MIWWYKRIYSLAWYNNGDCDDNDDDDNDEYENTNKVKSDQNNGTQKFGPEFLFLNPVFPLLFVEESIIYLFIHLFIYLAYYKRSLCTRLICSDSVRFAKVLNVSANRPHS